jgi:cytochrome c oxidase assembly factor CtaG
MNPHMQDDLAPLTWAHAFTTWRFAPTTAVLVAVAFALYLTAVVAVRRDGGRWPLARTVSFAAGLAVTAIAIMGSPGVYGDAGLLWVHMIQHLMLIMLAPWLLCYGHPVSLLRSATRGRVHDRVEAVRHSRVIGVLTWPLTGLALYGAVLFGVHLSSFMNMMMSSPALMAFEHLLYLGGGYLYFSQVLTADSPRHDFPYPLRLFSLFIAMSADTVVGVVLLQATHPPFPAFARMQPSWGPGPVADVHEAGAVMWIGGDGLMFTMMVVVATLWLTDRSPEAARAGNALESARRATLAGTGPGTSGDVGDVARQQLRASHDIDEDDAALDAYNVLLARLNSPESGTGER